MVVEVPRGEAPGGALGSGRPSGYLALRTLTHATSTRARANGVRHIMSGTLLRPTLTIIHAKPLMLLSLMASNHNNSKNHCNNCSGYKQLKSQPIISLTAIPHKEAHRQ